MEKIIYNNEWGMLSLTGTEIRPAAGKPVICKIGYDYSAYVKNTAHVLHSAQLPLIIASSFPDLLISPG